MTFGSVAQSAVDHACLEVDAGEKSDSIHGVVEVRAGLQVLVRLLDPFEVSLLSDEAHATFVLKNAHSLLLAAVAAVFKAIGSSHDLHVVHHFLFVLFNLLCSSMKSLSLNSKAIYRSKY